MKMDVVAGENVNPMSIVPRKMEDVNQQVLEDRSLGLADAKMRAAIAGHKIAIKLKAVKRQQDDV